MSPSDIETIDAIIRWVTSLASALLVPVALILLVVFLLRSENAPTRLRRLFEPFTSLKLFGQEVVLNNAAEFTSTAEATFLRYRAETQTKYSALVTSLNVAGLHKELVEKHLGPAIGGLSNASGLRSTIHVVDILFAESYFQLLPYLPAGGGDGRSWSIRYGIVGRTWRHMESYGEGNLKMSEADLIDQWGMTIEEASKAKSTRPSLIAIPLVDDAHERVGIFFADSESTDAFGSTETAWKEVSAKVERGAIEVGLTAALSNLVRQLPAEPLIPMLKRERK